MVSAPILLSGLGLRRACEALWFAGVALFVWRGLVTLQALVHPFHHIAGGPGWFGAHFDDSSRLPVALSLAIVGYAIVDRIVSAREGVAITPASRRLLVLAAAFLLLAQLVFWASDGARLVRARPEMRVYGAMLPVGLMGAVAAFALSRHAPWVSFVPPLVVLASAGVLIAWLASAGFPVSDAFVASDLAWPTLVLVVALAASMAELRASARATWRVPLALLACWLVALDAQLLVLVRVTWCLCATMARPSVIPLLGIAAVWCAAISARVWRARR